MRWSPGRGCATRNISPAEAARLDHPPAPVLEVITRFARELRELGPANFLYDDGDALFAYGHRRYQTDGTIRPPGLWQLARHCAAGGELNAEGLSIEAAGEQDLLVLASVPLTSEAWLPLAEGCVLAVRQGCVVTAG